MSQRQVSLSLCKNASYARHQNHNWPVNVVHGAKCLFWQEQPPVNLAYKTPQPKAGALFAHGLGQPTSSATKLRLAMAWPSEEWWPNTRFPARPLWSACRETWLSVSLRVSDARCPIWYLKSCGTYQTSESCALGVTRSAVNIYALSPHANALSGTPQNLQ